MKIEEYEALYPELKGMQEAYEKGVITGLRMALRSLAMIDVTLHRLIELHTAKETEQSK